MNESVEASPKRSQARRNIISAGVTLGCLAFLLKLVDVPALLSTIASADLRLIVIAVAIRVVDRFVMIAKWFPLLRIQLPQVGFVSAARAYLASGIAVYVIPISVGSDVLRATMLGRGEMAIPRVGASIIAERLLGLAATGILSVIALFIAVRASIDLTFLFPWALAAIAVGVVALVAPLTPAVASWLGRWLGRLRSGRVTGFAAQLATAYRAYGKHRRLLAGVGAASVFEQFLPVVFELATALALGVPVTLPMLMVVVPLALFAARIPPSIGGIGVTEGAMVYLLGLFGIPVEQALAMALVGRSIDILVMALPGAVLWRDFFRTPAAGR